MEKMYLLLITALIPMLLTGQNEEESSQKTIGIALEDFCWIYPKGLVAFKHVDGMPVMNISRDQGLVELDDASFSEGTIEYDVEFKGGRFVSIYFRRKDKNESECFYIRPSAGGDATRNDAIQYAPIIKGITLWDMLDNYQGSANLKSKGWNHIKLVISTHQMLVYVNSDVKPTLTVHKLMGNVNHGSIAFDGKSAIANIVIKPGEVEGLSPREGKDPVANDPRYLREWKISDPFPFPANQDMLGEQLPDEHTKWQPISAEYMGLINITRLHGGGENNNHQLVWLKTTIRSRIDTERTLDLGFSDDVAVFVNKELIYKDKNYYRDESMKEPAGRCALENASITLPLKKGENEILMGVGNFFYGWGVMARLKNVEGLVMNN